MFEARSEQDVVDRLGERAEQLGLHVWTLDDRREITSTPSIEGLNRAPRTTEMIRHAAEDAGARFTTADPAPGLTLLSTRIPLDQDGDVHVTMVAAIAEIPLGGAAALQANLVGAGVEEHVASALVSAARCSCSVDVARRCLDWSLEDLLQERTSREVLESIGLRLVQSYEETTMLFRLGRFMNNLTEPAEVMSMVCVQLAQVLPFAWVALRFRDTDHVLIELRGETVLSGTPIRSGDAVAAMLTDLAGRPGMDDWTRIVGPAQYPDAVPPRGEVIVEPIVHDDDLVGVLVAGDKTGEDPEVTSFEIQILDAAAEFLSVLHENLSRFQEHEAMFLGTLQALTNTIDAKDAYTHGHSERVATLAAQMARALRLDESTAATYRVAGLIHDIGKIGLPDAVLCKPSRLSEEEFALVKQHPTVGHEILRGIPGLDEVLPGVLHHHERWDGRGYPTGIADEEIPLIARVLALADTFDAMSSSRAYRSAMSREQVLEEIRRCSGSQFDPALVDVFLGLDFAEFDRLISVHSAQRQAA